jgi:hypothetical protein
MRDGVVYETIGRLRTPTSDDPVTRGDVLAKFRKMTRRFWSEETQNRAIILCDHLEEMQDSGELLALLQMESLAPMDLGGE